VSRGDRKSTLRKRGGFTDDASFRVINEHCGAYFQKGEIRLYCRNAADDPTGTQKGVTGDLGTWNNGAANRIFHGEGLCGTSPGILLSTEVEPPFWKTPPVDGPASRGFVVEWNCCSTTPTSRRFGRAWGEPARK
jgi:hypothetical protein